MYILIDNHSSLVGIFSTKEKMMIVVKEMIKTDIANTGICGNFHYKYAIVNVDEPYFFKRGKARPANSMDFRAMFSLHTLHDEYFTHRIINDETTGEILDDDYIVDNNG